ncbi:MAG: SpoIID/LytB domain-containing protein [Gemmatimonadetes bacterium]|nr:SpoIID/LytB domain-containing protein [Gemmatimonadota bacterium]
MSGREFRRLTIVAAMAGGVVAMDACVTRRVREPGPPRIVLPPGESAPDTVRLVEAPPNLPPDLAPAVPVDGVRDVRVALATSAQEAPLTATGPWRLYDGSNGVLVRGRPNDQWTVERRGRQLRATLRSGQSTPWVDSDVTLRPDAESQFVRFAGRRYRGAIRVVAGDSGITVVNVLGVEEYLRGVVPLEIGATRGPSEQAAVEAQAIAARSYTWVRLESARNGGRDGSGGSYDVVATVNDQVYGGADAEREGTDRAVRTTAGQVIKFAGRVVDAPYSSSCGGETAAPEEVWRGGPSSYLRRVSDRIPGTSNRYYCDIAPRFAWTKEFSSAELDAAVRSYLRAYSDAPAGGPGHVRGFSIESRTPSGRVGNSVFLTERGSFNVRGNDIRYVLRAVGGEILNSTYFSVNTETARDGSLARLLVRGNGYGHGVGMCQWGAIGRARAGQTARSILAAYYPGTTVGPATTTGR